jgi:hypothetical protein
MEVLFISVLNLFHRHIKLKETQKIKVVFTIFYALSLCSCPKQPKKNSVFLGVFGKFYQMNELIAFSKITTTRLPRSLVILL